VQTILPKEDSNIIVSYITCFVNCLVVGRVGPQNTLLVATKQAPPNTQIMMSVGQASSKDPNGVKSASATTPPSIVIPVPRAASAYSITSLLGNCKSASFFGILF